MPPTTWHDFPLRTGRAQVNGTTNDMTTGRTNICALPVVIEKLMRHVLTAFQVYHYDVCLRSGNKCPICQIKMKLAKLLLMLIHFFLGVEFLGKMALTAGSGPWAFGVVGGGGLDEGNPWCEGWCWGLGGMPPAPGPGPGEWLGGCEDWGEGWPAGADVDVELTGGPPGLPGPCIGGPPAQPVRTSGPPVL